MKIRSKVISNADQGMLVELRKDYIMLGFETSLDKGQLTVYARRSKAELTKNRSEKKEEKNTRRPRRSDS